MPEYVQFPSSNGKIIVEIEETETNGRVGSEKASLKDWFGNPITEAKSSLSDAMEIVGQSANAFLNKLESLDEKPETVEISFGIKAVGNVGVFAIAKVSADANFSVKIVWKPNSGK